MAGKTLQKTFVPEYMFARIQVLFSRGGKPYFQHMTRVQMKMLMSTAMKAVMGEVPASMWEICVLSVNDKQEAVIRIPKEGYAAIRGALTLYSKHDKGMVRVHFLAISHFLSALANEPYLPSIKQTV